MLKYLDSVFFFCNDIKSLEKCGKVCSEDLRFSQLSNYIRKKNHSVKIWRLVIIIPPSRYINFGIVDDPDLLKTSVVSFVDVEL